MSPIFGKLTWDAVPFHEPIPLITSGVVLLGVLAVTIIVWRKGWWPYLRDEYITSTDHKRIGIMYIVLALLMLVRGVAGGRRVDAAPPPPPPPPSPWSASCSGGGWAGGGGAHGGGKTPPPPPNPPPTKTPAD